MKKLQNSKKNSLYKAHTQTKKVLVMVLVGFFLLFLMGTVSAMDWDNVKSYDEETRTVTVINALNLPLISYDIAKIQLITPSNYKVSRGYQKVAEFKLYDFEKDYVNAFKNMDFYQINNDFEEFERDFDYKYLDYVNEEQAIYGEVCGDKYVNGTLQKVCETKEIDKETIQVPVWIKFNDVNELPSNQDNFTIGIFTNVQKGDKVEWIPTFFGVKINEWAVWTEDMNVGLTQYFNFAESSGAIIDTTGQLNGTNSGGTYTATGIIEDGHQFTANTQYVNTNQKLPTTADFTINIWFNSTITSLERIFTQDCDNPVGGRFCFQIDNTQVQAYVQDIIDITETINLKDGNFHMVTLRRDGTNFSLFIDGDFKGSEANAGGIIQTDNLHIASSNGVQEGWIGNADEYGFWNISLADSVITDNLWNGGSGNTQTYIYGPIITLNFPVDTFNTTNPIITFNATVHNNVKNVTLIINGIENETNSSGINDTDYIFIKTLSDGNYNWTIRAFDNINRSTIASIKTFTIDTTAPIINITYPTETVNYHLINTNLSLNWTVFDISLDSCWYNYNGTNVSVTCLDNHTNINITDYSNRNVTFYTNDTFGFLGSDYQEWNYTVFGNEKVYNSSSFETEEETFWINITTNGITPTNAKLIYNGTSYSADITNTVGNDYNVSRAIDIPTGIGNKDFFFNFTAVGTEISSSVQTQLINLTNFTHCTIGTPFINISFKNETISEESITAAISSTWNYWLGSGTTSKPLSFSNVSENPYYGFCLIGINKTLGTNVSLIYSNSISQQRNFVGDFSLTNVTTNQTLYLLPTTEGLYVTFQVIGISEQPISGVSSNVTKAGVLIGSGITDDAGTISYFLDPDSSYTFTFFKTGYDIYVTTLTPTQTTFTIILGAEEVVEVDDYTRGITYSVSPGAISLVNDTNTYFNFTLTSTYWDVEEFGFNLTNQDGDLLDSTSASTNGGTIFILHNTLNDTTITMTFFWTINENVSIGSTFWTVLDSSGRGFGLTTFFTHLTAYLNTEMFGLNSNSMVILIYIVIFIAIGIMSFKYGITSPTAISLMIFGLVFLFEVHLEWIPSISGFPILTILFAIVSIALILKEELR